jgi:endogenous inhibitor of DNA gyrase (YacG/DUF329 family)
VKPIEIKCPWCFALAGEPCNDIQLGRWVDGFHHNRVAAVSDAAKMPVSNVSQTENGDLDASRYK